MSAGTRLAALAALGIGGAMYAWWESTSVEITRRSLFVPELPPGLDGLRVLHISDTHFPESGDSVGRFLELIWPLEYDLILCTGDYVETAAGWDAAGDALTQLRAPFGVYATFGAHDYCAPVRSFDSWVQFNLDRLRHRRRRMIDPAPFVRRLESAGIVVLRNEWRSAEIGGELVRIAGAGDASVGMARVEQALPPAELRPEAFDVLLTHSPDAALGLRANAHAPRLVFSGHTHGGQIRVPGWGAPVRHSNLVSRENAAGVFQPYGSAGPQVVVSRGFGTAFVPFRFACRPELGLYELRRSEGSSRPDP